MLKQITGRESPAEIKRIARECARKCGCTDGELKSIGAYDDTIVVDEDDLRAVLSQRQQRDDDIVVVDEDDLRDVLNRR
jgi:phosphomevalonate kinase